MSNVKGNYTIILQPGDTSYGVTVHFPAKESESDNSGWLPYGTTLAGVDSYGVYDKDGEEVTSYFISNAPTISGTEYMTFGLTYPGDSFVGGRYTIKTTMLLSNDATRGWAYSRIKVKSY